MLDMRTVLSMGALSFLVCTILLWLLKLKVGRREHGVGSWALGFSLEFAGLLLVSIRGHVPDAVSIVLANLFVQAGVVFIFRGYARFVGLPRRLWPDAVLLSAFTLVHAWFTFVRPDLEARSMNLAICMTLICLQIVQVLVSARRGRGPALFCASVNLGYVVVNLARIAITLDLGPTGEDFMKSGQLEVLWQLAYQLLFLAETAGMAYMVLGRLNDELSESEEKFSKAFHASPCAIAITDAESGKFEEVNEGFSAISGYSVAESVGKTSAELGLWFDSGRRGAIMDEVLGRGELSWTDLRFLGKEGATIDALVAAETLAIGGRKAVLWTVNDISERKRMEEDIRSLLREKETLLKEIHHRVKNNMSSVAGLLSLEAGGLGEDSRAGSILEEAASQVQGMAVLYERIYSTEHYSSMPLDEFLAPLVRETLQSYPASATVRLELGLDSRPVPPRFLLPIGMIATELVCNAMKYAFAGREGGVFSLRSSGSPGLVLDFSDDGPGFDPSTRREGGFGLSMVQALAEQLHGRVSVDGSHGCSVRVELDRLGQA